MRRRNKYYLIESYIYDKDWFLIRKKSYYYARFRDFHSELIDIIKNRFDFEHITRVSVLKPPSILYVHAHEVLSEAFINGFSSACDFFDFSRD